MRLLFCGYRDWALRVHASLAAEWPMDVVSDPAEFERMASNAAYDVVILVGWSWLVPKQIVESLEVIGMHPSDLPNYAGGSPIQNQIIDGVEQTAISLFRLTPALDGGPVIDKEPVSLTGHLSEVLTAIEKASVIVIRRYLLNWPNNSLMPQPGERPRPRRRLTPASSRLTAEHIGKLTCRQLWNFIRCREDPYPNVFLEDETGRLTIRWVEFEPKNLEDKDEPK